MQITAAIRNTGQQNDVSIATNGHAKTLALPAKGDGGGSAVNGGELLLLALATCCCNDIYREAAKRGLPVRSVAVQVRGEFNAEGEPGRNLIYEVQVEADASEAEVNALIEHVDAIAEVHNTLRLGTTVTLRQPNS